MIADEEIAAIRLRAPGGHSRLSTIVEQTFAHDIQRLLAERELLVAEHEALTGANFHPDLTSKDQRLSIHAAWQAVEDFN